MGPAALSPGPTDFADQSGQVGRDDGPDDVVVHRCVAVDEAVTHSNDLEPRNRRETSPSGRRYLRCRFAHNFDESFEGRGENVVGIEVPTLLTSDGSDGSPRVIDHIPEENLVFRPLQKAKRPPERHVAGSVG